MNTPLPDYSEYEQTYYQLLRDAFEASEAVDKFDLHSEDPTSVKEWNILVANQGRAQGLLVQYAKDNFLPLSFQLGVSMANKLKSEA